MYLRTRLNELDEVVKNAQDAVQQQASTQQTIYQKFEEKVRISLEPSRTSAANQINFEVKPLRLIGAPATVDFVDRSLVMRRIEDALLPIQTSEQNIVVCHGMGGIGKSQLVKRIAETHSLYSAIFWINAKSLQTLRLGIAKIAERVPLLHSLDSNGRIQTDETSIQEAKEAVESWLDQEGKTYFEETRRQYHESPR